MCMKNSIMCTVMNIYRTLDVIKCANKLHCPRGDWGLIAIVPPCAFSHSVRSFSLCVVENPRHLQADKLISNSLSLQH